MTDKERIYELVNDIANNHKVVGNEYGGKFKNNLYMKKWGTFGRYRSNADLILKYPDIFSLFGIKADKFRGEEKWIYYNGQKLYFYNPDW